MEHQKVALITGANTGIGRETALALAKEEMKVFIACRNYDKGRAAVAYIQEKFPAADVEILLLDLKSLESVRKCASEFKSKKLPLHVLVNNAGLTMGKSWYTEEGVGGSAQVNYLGHYALTRLLEDELTLGAPSRVVTVSSITHRQTKIPDAEKFLRTFKAGLYPECKLASVLFSSEGQRQWQGKGIEFSAVDPGAVWSDIWRRSSYSKPPISWILKTVFSPTSDGAKAVIYASTAPYGPPKKGNIRYFARGLFASPMVTHPFPFPLSSVLQVLGPMMDWPIRRISGGRLQSQTKDVPAAPAAYNSDLAASLWKSSAIAAGFDSK